MAFQEVIGNIRVYADFWVQEQFCATLEQDVFNKFVSLFSKETQLTLNGDWLHTYVGDGIEGVNVYYVAKILTTGEIQRLEKRTAVISADEQQRKVM